MTKYLQRLKQKHILAAIVVKECGTDKARQNLCGAGRHLNPVNGSYAHGPIISGISRWANLGILLAVRLDNKCD